MIHYSLCLCLLFALQSECQTNFCGIRNTTTQNGEEILVDATGDYLYEDETGQIRCKTKYKIEGHSITTLSHDVQVHRKSLRAD